MPLHDWTRVSTGTFHDFHNSWITHLKEASGAGLLPPPYYALGEQRARDVGPDVLTLRQSESEPPPEAGGMVALASAPPRVELAQEATGDLAHYLARQRSVVIRHASGDSVVALIEIVSPANKHSQQMLDRFADKVIAALRESARKSICPAACRGRRAPRHASLPYAWPLPQCAARRDVRPDLARRARALAARDRE